MTSSPLALQGHNTQNQTQIYRDCKQVQTKRNNMKNKKQNNRVMRCHAVFFHTITAPVCHSRLELKAIIRGRLKYGQPFRQKWSQLSFNSYW